MTFNDKETEEPMGMGMVMLVGAIAGALSAVAVAMITGNRPSRRSRGSGRSTLPAGEAVTFESVGGGHFPPGQGAGGGHFAAANPPSGGGHGGGSSGGGHGGGSSGGGHGGGSSGGGHGGGSSGGGHG